MGAEKAEKFIPQRISQEVVGERLLQGNVGATEGKRFRNIIESADRVAAATPPPILPSMRGLCSITACFFASIPLPFLQT